MNAEHSSSSDAPRETPSKWLDVTAAAAYLNIGKRSVYVAARKGELRVVRLFAKREIRTTVEWCDQYMLAHATPEPVIPMVSARRREAGR